MAFACLSTKFSRVVVVSVNFGKNLKNRNCERKQMFFFYFVASFDHPLNPVHEFCTEIIDLRLFLEKVCDTLAAATVALVLAEARVPYFSKLGINRE